MICRRVTSICSSPVEYNKVSLSTPYTPSPGRLPDSSALSGVYYQALSAYNQQLSGGRSPRQCSEVRFVGGTLR